MLPELRGKSYPKLIDISDWLPTIFDMGMCKRKADLQSQETKFYVIMNFKAGDELNV